MKAMISAWAASVGESAFARGWSRLGDFLDCVIPIVLLVLILIAAGAMLLGFLN